LNSWPMPSTFLPPREHELTELLQRRREREEDR
jgi:hypothetical protein